MYVCLWPVTNPDLGCDTSHVRIASQWLNASPSSPAASFAPHVAWLSCTRRLHVVEQKPTDCLKAPCTRASWFFTWPSGLLSSPMDLHVFTLQKLPTCANNSSRSALSCLPRKLFSPVPTAVTAAPTYVSSFNSSLPAWFPRASHYCLQHQLLSSS